MPVAYATSLASAAAAAVSTDPWLPGLQAPAPALAVLMRCTVRKVLGTPPRKVLVVGCSDASIA